MQLSRMKNREEANLRKLDALYKMEPSALTSTQRKEIVSLEAEVSKLQSDMQDIEMKMKPEELAESYSEDASSNINLYEGIEMTEAVETEIDRLTFLPFAGDKDALTKEEIAVLVRHKFGKKEGESPSSTTPTDSATEAIIIAPMPARSSSSPYRPPNEPDKKSSRPFGFLTDSRY